MQVAPNPGDVASEAEDGGRQLCPARTPRGLLQLGQIRLPLCLTRLLDTDEDHAFERGFLR